MRFFFVDDAPESLQGSWRPPPHLRRHLHALRMASGEEFLLLLPQGGAILARLDGRDTVELCGLTEMPTLKLLPVVLATAWPKGSRADNLVVRAVEAGVERILPIVCDRSVAGREPFPENRIERWNRLARETCQQAGRPYAPAIDPSPVPLREVGAEAPRAHPVALDPGGWPLSMELTLHTPREVLLLVGPEGGFSEEERAWFAEEEIPRASLLPTVLRVEAAGPTAVAICQHWFHQFPSR